MEVTKFANFQQDDGALEFGQRVCQRHINAPDCDTLLG